jgi:glyoxylase-like metal-dependent hydrolase (beta-lactamase superfamily II)
LQEKRRGARVPTDLPVADAWFTVEEVSPGIHLVTEPYCHRLVRANCYFVKGTERDLLVDTGMGIASMRAVLAPLTDRPLILFTTHNHIDHGAGHHEFTDAEILVHPLEREGLAHPLAARGLGFEQFGSQKEALRIAGFDVDRLLIDAIPSADYDPDAYEYRGVEASRTVEEGDVVDLGDRRFTVLHLPGHSPGSIALFEEATGILIAGDAIYDGILIDNMEGSDVPTYLKTMARMRALPVSRVFGGHRQHFDRARLVEIIDIYVASRTG